MIAYAAWNYQEGKRLIARYNDENMWSDFCLVPVALLLASCGSREPAPLAGGPRAVVQLRDGTTISGQVVASSPRQIVVAGDDKVTRTVDMKQVKAVEYADSIGDGLSHAPDTGMAGREPAPVPAPSGAQPVAEPGSVSQRPAPQPVAQAPQTAPQAVPPPADITHETHVHPSEGEVRTRTYVLPAGTQLAIRTEETIDASRAAEGQTFAAEAARSAMDSEGAVVIPKGANATIVIRSATRGGRFKGASDLALDLQSISIDGRNYALDTVDLVQKGREGVGTNKRTAEFGGAGAAVGAIIGAIAGGGKGAAIGAGSGAGAGVITQVITKGGSIKIPAETILTFQLERSLRVKAR